MTSNPKSLPLVWEFDGKGEWEATSMIIDPGLNDEPADQRCREWCLVWRLVVREDGTFAAGDSDSLLLERKELKFKSWTSLSVLQAQIDLAEDSLRCAGEFICGQKIVLLPIEKFKS